MYPCDSAPLTAEHFLQHCPLHVGLRGDTWPENRPPEGEAIWWPCGAEEDSSICEGHWGGHLKGAIDDEEEEECFILSCPQKKTLGHDSLPQGTMHINCRGSSGLMCQKYVYTCTDVEKERELVYLCCTFQADCLKTVQLSKNTFCVKCAIVIFWESTWIGEAWPWFT